ncbi:AbrB/MazE/SpoVT family DNA-binding domain-containing protein [Homoserinimonas sp. A520]
MNHLVGAKGQVVIPKEIRDALGIKPGQEVVFERRGDEVVLRSAPRAPLFARFANNALADALLRERSADQSFESR